MEQDRRQANREAAMVSLETGADAALAVGGWVRSLAVDEAKAEGELARVLGAHGGPWGSLAREVYGSLYGLGCEPVEGEPKGAAWVRELLSQAESLPEWRALQARAEGDAWASGLAAAQALDALAPVVQPPEEDAQQAREAAEAVSEANPHSRRLPGLQARAEAAEAADEAAAQQAREAVSRVRRALRTAAAKADAQLGELEEAATGLGCGSEAGSPGRIQGPRSEVVQRLRSDERLRRIAKLAGRLRAQAIQKQNTKAAHGREELCDVESGDDLGRLLPSESVLLADEDLEALLYRRLLERSALQYQLRGQDHRAEGPIVLCLDESGSMKGARDEWAKAVALALMEVAARQGRAFSVVHFDGAVTSVDRFAQPKAVGLDALLACVSSFSGGGTSIASALGEANRLLRDAAEQRAFARADVVLITDGVDHDRDGQLRQLDGLRAHGAALFAVGIASAVPAWISDRATQTVVVQTNDLDGASAKLDGVFSM